MQNDTVETNVVEELDLHIEIEQNFIKTNEQTSLVLVTNFTIVEEKIKNQLALYKSMDYGENAIKLKKKDLAMIRKVETDFNKRCVEAKNKLLEPYEIIAEARDRIKKLFADTTISMSADIKVSEDLAREKKKKEIRSLFDEFTKNVPAILFFDNIFKDKWLNVNETMKSITEELKGIVDQQVFKFTNDLETIEKMDADQSIKDKAIEKYKVSKDLASSMQIILTYQSQKASILAEKQESDRIALETQKRNEMAQLEALEKERKEADRKRETEFEEKLAKVREEERIKADQKIAIELAETNRLRKIKEQQEQALFLAKQKEKEEIESAERIRKAQELQEKEKAGETRFKVIVSNLTREKSEMLCLALNAKDYEVNCCLEE